jgi:hypothetical protein
LEVIFPVVGATKANQWTAIENRVEMDLNPVAVRIRWLLEQFPEAEINGKATGCCIIQSTHNSEATVSESIHGDKSIHGDTIEAIYQRHDRSNQKLIPDSKKDSKTDSKKDSI